MGTSPRSDIYGLSATLYQLMSNNIPADALSRADALLNGMPDPLIPVYEVNPEIQPVVSDVIMKGMEISQDKRHQSAREMQKALRDSFAEMQSAMAAQTVAFKMPVKDTAPIVNTPAAAPPETAPEVPPVVEAPVPEAPVPFVADVGDMDATRRYEPAAVASVPEQEDTPANIEPVPVEENISQPTTDDEFLTVERSGLAAGTLDPYATVMTDPAAPAPGAAPQTPHAVAAPPVRKVTVPADAPVAPAGRSVAPAKKSSKKGLLVGGLAALFLLIAAGGAGGWFVYQKYYAAAVPTPSPSPVATASPSPTVEMPVGTNMLDNSNTATIPDVNSNRGTNTGPEGTPKPAVKATPVKTPPPAKTPPPRLKTEL